MNNPILRAVKRREAWKQLEEARPAYNLTVRMRRLSREQLRFLAEYRGDRRHQAPRSLREAAVRSGVIWRSYIERTRYAWTVRWTRAVEQSDFWQLPGLERFGLACLFLACGSGLAWIAILLYMALTGDLS